MTEQKHTQHIPQAFMNVFFIVLLGFTFLFEMIASMMHPDQWKIDKKSLFLIIFGIPTGIAVFSVSYYLFTVFYLR